MASAARTAVLWTCSIICVGSHTALALSLAEDGHALCPIVLADDATGSERTAADELAAYLGRITGAEFAVITEREASEAAPAIYVGPTLLARQSGLDASAMGAEEWSIRTTPRGLVIGGGRPRGTLYAAYHFLEDVLGVRWWNPWEETVPSVPALVVEDLDRSGEPAFAYRDIYMLYGEDDGRFAARARLNRQGDRPVAPELGGAMNYGPPYHVHTFHPYVRPEEHFAEHPEWFALVDGARRDENAQLCLTNQGLRDFVLERLEAFIAAEEKKSEETGAPAPLVYSISQNDCAGACQCETCQAIVEAEGAESGVLIDFVNYLAERIAPEHPEVFIDTLAYQYTQDAPRTIHARENVIVRLCDTTNYYPWPITHPENSTFHDQVESWAERADHLRIWDYAVTYPSPVGLPVPTLHTYPVDYQFYAEHNVEGVFTEFEFPVLADMRDLRVWVMAKLLEDPKQELDDLVQTFTDGFYGPAGPAVRRYVTALEAACEERPSYVGWMSTTPAMGYLDLDFIVGAQSIFDEGEQSLVAVADDPTMLQRVRHARLPLDRATLILYRQLLSQWVTDGGAPEAFPIDRDALAERIRTTWHAARAQRIPESQWATSGPDGACDAEVDRYLALGRHMAPPERFKGLPPGTVYDFTADMARNWLDIVKVVPDPEAESGVTCRLDFPITVDATKHPLERYLLPMHWGVYEQHDKKDLGVGFIAEADVPGPGYHWYKIGDFQVGPTAYVYVFSTWIIQMDVGSAFDPAAPDQPYEIWARVKFEGGSFPHGEEGTPDAICVERIVLVAGAH